MIIVMKKGFDENQLRKVLERIVELGANPFPVSGREQTTISVVGPTHEIEERAFLGFEGIEKVVRVSKPYKLAARLAQAQPTQIKVGECDIGDGSFLVMAGPCSVESEEQTLRIAHAVKKAGATMLRGGAFKPRSSPYSFQGMGAEGLKILKQAKEETGLPIVSEVMDIQQLELALDVVDMLQIGARNMQNFALLKELGKVSKPILLKRGMSATVEEWLMSAEYIMAGGNSQVLLCERGIRSFDNQFARNSLDLNVVPILRELTHLPVVVDPSHGTGYRHLVSPMALAGMAAGADALIVEVHDRPSEALSDGPQALLPTDLDQLMLKLSQMGDILGKRVQTSQTAKQNSEGAKQNKVA